jgi:hypothetical protein
VQNKDAAQLVGVNIAWVQALTFGIGLATVAAGGALFSMIWTFNAGDHEEWISKLLSIIVLGGMGSLPGALIAALISFRRSGGCGDDSYISPCFLPDFVHYPDLSRRDCWARSSKGKILTDSCAGGLPALILLLIFPWVYREPYFMCWVSTCSCLPPWPPVNIMGDTGYKSLAMPFWLGEFPGCY